ncbi:MAG: TetR/AcrR family transcriptional regulator [Polyangiaceae bacterium]|nr:TetR/AcrR family transcriptional regulator [Polyangiaceae bacterium]
MEVSPPGDRLGSFFSLNKILAGAADVFRQKGVDASTVEDILLAAGVSRRTFYKAFANKEEVLVALHRELSGLLMSVMRNALEGAKTARERLERCVDVYLLAAQRSGGLMLELQAQALRTGKLAERRKAVLTEMAELVEETSQKENRSLVDPLLVFGVLAGMEAVVRQMMESGRLTDSDMARARRVLVRLAAGALAEPGDDVPPLPVRL